LSSSKKQLPIDALRLGMYVVELDRPWVETSFAFQGFLLESQGQIEKLRSYCKTVFVDPERETWVPEKRSRTDSLQGSATPFDAVPFESELPVAKEIYSSCEHALTKLLTSVCSEGEIDARALTTAMTSMIESIQRSPGALLLLNAVRRKKNFELARAMDTSILMLAFGRYLQFPAARLEALGLAGLLLDVGMTNLPNDIVQAFHTDEGLDDGLIETHVMHSVDLVRGARGMPSRVDEIVLLHHERQDGEGYPYGLVRDQISVDGAIAAIVDSYSKLTCPRPDARQVSPSRALNILHNRRGHAFDEALVEQFIQCIGVYPVGSAVELNTGETGLVVAQNPVRRLLPRVMVMFDADGGLIHPHLMLDLMKEPKTPSGQPYRIRRTMPSNDELPLDASELLI
jgi:HD-GYP domain-containing protein (c-di-GMP phosphodiesterase class II)